MNKKKAIQISITVLSLIAIVLYIAYKRFEVGMDRAHDRNMLKQLGLGMVMYFDQNKDIKYLVKNNNFIDTYVEEHLRYFYKNIDVRYHYNIKDEYETMNNYEYKMLSYDGFILYGNGYTEDTQ